MAILGWRYADYSNEDLPYYNFFTNFSKLYHDLPNEHAWKQHCSLEFLSHPTSARFYLPDLQDITDRHGPHCKPRNRVSAISTLHGYLRTLSTANAIHRRHDRHYPVRLPANRMSPAEGSSAILGDAGALLIKVLWHARSRCHGAQGMELAAGPRAAMEYSLRHRTCDSRGRGR